MKKVLLKICCFLFFVPFILLVLGCFLASPIMGFLLVIPLIILIFSVFKSFDEIIKSFSYKYLFIIFLLPYFLIIALLVGSLIHDKVSMLHNWNKVKGNYELINEFVLDYYNNNCEDECYIYFDESAKLSWLDNLHYIDRSELSSELSDSIDIISDYQEGLNYLHKGFSFIKINSEYVKYVSFIPDVPDFFIIYSRSGKSYSEHHFDCYYNECNSHLTGRWYQNNYQFLR